MYPQLKLINFQIEKKLITLYFFKVIGVNYTCTFLNRGSFPNLEIQKKYVFKFFKLPVQKFFIQNNQRLKTNVCQFCWSTMQNIWQYFMLGF